MRYWMFTWWLFVVVLVVCICWLALFLPLDVRLFVGLYLLDLLFMVCVVLICGL